MGRRLGDVDALIGIGWTPNSLKPGDQITIDGWQAKNGTNRANAKSITMPNAAPLSAASSYGAAPQGQLASARQSSTVGTSGEELPRTGSPLALLGLIGVLSLAGGVTLRSFRR